MTTTESHGASSAVLTTVSRLTAPRLAVPFLLTFALLLRLPNLLESLWLDEVLKSTQYTSSLEMLWRFIAHDIAAPFYSVAMFVWVRVTGEHELAVRLPALVLGLGSIVLAYLIARRLGGSGLLAGLMLCLSPAHVWYSQEATQYTMYTFFVLCAVYVWPRVSTLPFSWKAHTVYILALLAACFTHYYAALFLIPFTILAFRSDRSLLTTILLAHVVVVAALSLWLFSQYLRGSVAMGQGHLRPFSLFEWWMLFFHWLAHGNTLWIVNPYGARLDHVAARPLMLVLQLVLLALMVRGLWPDRTSESRWRTVELGLYLFVLPVALFLMTLVGFDRMYIERYMLVVLPFFAIAVARGVSSIRFHAVRAVATVGLLVLSAVSYASLVREDVRWTVYKHNPDWRSAASAVRTRHNPGERQILFGVIPLDDFAFYLRHAMESDRPEMRWYDDRGFDRLVSSGMATQIVIVRNGAWASGVDRAINRAREDRRLRLAWHDRFKLVDLYTFVPAETGPGAERLPAATP